MPRRGRRCDHAPGLDGLVFLGIDMTRPTSQERPDIARKRGQV
ncbi:hypothetical protein AB0D12_40725 [Streptomyces sp. NPDC048479]